LRSFRHKSRSEQGQILIFLALAFMGLLAFIGLATDIGILFISMGHLRRGVDAAALAASAQFREGRTYDEIRDSAIDFFELNEGQVISSTILVETCLTTDPLYPNPGLCPNPPRKFVRVTGNATVAFTFLRLIGWQSIDISANAVSEAASLDVVLVLDTSESMAFDASCNDGDDDDGDGTTDECGDFDGNGTIEPCVDWGSNCVEDDYYRKQVDLRCNVDSLNLDPGDGLPGECHPFEEVKAAAISFVNNLNPPFDRVAVVTFAQTPNLQFQLQSDLSAAVSLIRNLNVSEAPLCNYPASSPDPSPCTSTSIGGGLLASASAFSQPLGGINNIREESLWVVILLTDGAANASVPDSGTGIPVNVYCPPSTWPPTSPWPPTIPACRDSSGLTRHSILSGGKTNPNNTYDPNNYDTDDFARDMADLVACPTKYDPSDTAFDHWCLDGLNYAVGEGGQNALIFTIGLGDLVVDTNLGDPDAGEQLLRYAAGVGADSSPNPNWPTLGTDDCIGVPVGQDCGNYFFAPSGAQLIQIFEEIASRIFTRLTQ
jgi:hypothetical protein